MSHALIKLSWKLTLRPTKSFFLNGAWAKFHWPFPKTTAKPNEVMEDCYSQSWQSARNQLQSKSWLETKLYSSPITTSSISFRKRLIFIPRSRARLAGMYTSFCFLATTVTPSQPKQWKSRQSLSHPGQRMKAIPWTVLSLRSTPSALTLEGNN